MSVPAKPEPVDFGEVEETEIQIKWKAVEGATGYKIQVKDFVHVEEEWGGENTKEHKFGADKTSATIDELYPTSTFQFRLIAFNEQGDSVPSDEMDCDTKVANCGPEKKSCIVM